jgi:cytochrome c556
MWKRRKKRSKFPEEDEMRRVFAVVVIVVIGGGWALCVSSAHEGHAKHLPDGKDIIALRTYLMENVGDNAKELDKKVKAGDIAAAKVNAQTIALHAMRVRDLFPQGSTSATSRAKDEIWQKWDEFVKDADTLKTEADQLAVTIADGKADAVGVQLKKVFGSCKSCHDVFRKPEEKKK